VVSYAVSPACQRGLALNYRHRRSSLGNPRPSRPRQLTRSQLRTARKHDGRGEHHGEPTFAPSGLTYSTNPAATTKDSTITAHTQPQRGGAVVSYAVSPRASGTRVEYRHRRHLWETHGPSRPRNLHGHGYEQRRKHLGQCPRFTVNDVAPERSHLLHQSSGLHQGFRRFAANTPSLEWGRSGGVLRVSRRCQRDSR